jgi:hypothetical protein
VGEQAVGVRLARVRVVVQAHRAVGGVVVRRGALLAPRAVAVRAGLHRARHVLDDPLGRGERGAQLLERPALVRVGVERAVQRGAEAAGQVAPQPAQRGRAIPTRRAVAAAPSARTGFVPVSAS